MKTHTENHSIKAIYKCQKCENEFNDQEVLNTHVETHNTKNEVQCNKCDEIYSDMSKLRRHDWRTHRNIECNICGKNLKSRQEIGEHRKTEHKMDKKIKCKFYPDCIDGNECFFIHGAELAENVQKRSKYCPR